MYTFYLQTVKILQHKWGLLGNRPDLSRVKLDLVGIWFITSWSFSTLAPDHWI